MGSTRPRSSGRTVPGDLLNRWSWQPRSGSTGGTTGVCMVPSAISHRLNSRRSPITSATPPTRRDSKPPSLQKTQGDSLRSDVRFDIVSQPALQERSKFVFAWVHIGPRLHLLDEFGEC